MKPNLNGMRIIARTKEAIYLRIPREFQQETGGCSCDHCKRDPANAGMWDTLAVPVAKGREYGDNHSWTVHMPDGAVQAFVDYCQRKGLIE